MIAQLIRYYLFRSVKNIYFIFILIYAIQAAILTDINHRRIIKTYFSYGADFLQTMNL